MQIPGAKSKPAILGDRALSLKWHLVLLITGILLPFVIFAFIVTYKSSMDERADAQRRLLATARNLNDTLEREFSGSIRALQSLAASNYLEQNDLKGFYEEAKRTNQTQPTWRSVILISADGRPLINTNRPYGEEPSPLADPKSFQKILETKQPTVGNISRGAGNTLAFPVRIPVLRNNELRYVLTAVITTDALNEILKKDANRNAEWTRTIVDGQGFIAARTRNPEQFVGEPASEQFLKETNKSLEGVFRTVSLDNVLVYVGFERIPESNWIASVVVPSDLIDDLGIQAMSFVVATGIAFLFFSCLGALILARRISREIVTAASTAQMLVRGETLNIKTPSRIEEVKQLNEALQFSSKMLSEREEEREKHLADAEEARAAAESANKLKDEFLITVSHELRTPLNAILGWITLLRTSKFNQQQVEHAHEVIERNAKSQTKLIEDLLDVSRIITGKLTLETQDVDLTATIKNAVEALHHAAESKNVELQFKIYDDIPAIAGDPNRLQQVVWNLISNAVKFTPSGGRILVELKKTDSEIQISVSDTGKGINPDFLPFVFERFRQADGSTKRNYGGLGLGLAIVKQLIELHGGSVKALSDGADEGATFIVSLPLKTQTEYTEYIEAKTPKMLNVSTENRAELNGVKILIVDDEPDTRELVESILSQRGAEVRTSDSVSAALLELKQWTPTIVLSDIGMPNEDGYDFIQRLREFELNTGRKIPAAALTAYTRYEDRAKALSAGYIQHIPKPIDSFELINVVAGIVANR